MVDYATTLNTALDRVVVRVVDDIAVDGLKILRKVLIRSGFLESEYLKGFGLTAEVINNVIYFAIELEVDSVEVDDEEKRKYLEAVAKTRSMYKVVKRAMKMYKMDGDQVVRVGESKTTSADRLASHESALHAPRGMRMTPTGKLFITLRRTLEKTDTRRYRYPKREPEGITKEFLEEFKTQISKKFASELKVILRKYML